MCTAGKLLQFLAWSHGSSKEAAEKEGRKPRKAASSIRCWSQEGRTRNGMSCQESTHNGRLLTSPYDKLHPNFADSPVICNDMFSERPCSEWNVWLVELVIPLLWSEERKLRTVA